MSKPVRDVRIDVDITVKVTDNELGETKTIHHHWDEQAAPDWTITVARMIKNMAAEIDRQVGTLVEIRFENGG